MATEKRRKKKRLSNASCRIQALESRVHLLHLQLREVVDRFGSDLETEETGRIGRAMSELQKAKFRLRRVLDDLHLQIRGFCQSQS